MPRAVPPVILMRRCSRLPAENAKVFAQKKSVPAKRIAGTLFRRSRGNAYLCFLPVDLKSFFTVATA